MVTKYEIYLEDKELDISLLASMPRSHYNSGSKMYFRDCLLRNKVGA